MLRLQTILIEKDPQQGREANNPYRDMYIIRTLLQKVHKIVEINTHNCHPKPCKNFDRFQAPWHPIQTLWFSSAQESGTYVLGLNELIKKPHVKAGFYKCKLSEPSLLLSFYRVNLQFFASLTTV